MQNMGWPGGRLSVKGCKSLPSSNRLFEAVYLLWEKVM